MDIQDRELLELAAKAAGITGADDGAYSDLGILIPSHLNTPQHSHYEVWNPLTDDGYAFQLMLALQIDISFWREDDSVCCSIHGNLAATAVGAIGDIELRRAIVRAAAEIGRSMP